jgi:short-subunit dehydrogenase
MSTPGLAIITGGSAGIGAAMARQLHARGWKLGLIARRAEPLEALAADLGEGVGWRVADVCDAESLRLACAALQDELGPCELLLANAGIGTPTRMKGMDPALVARVMRVNFEGVVNAVAAVLPGMLERGGGHLAATSSYAGWTGMPTTAAYSASKAAVSTFMESLRVALRTRGVAVTTLHPGYVRTELTAENRFWMPFLMDPEPFAARAVRGLLKRRAEVNVPWPLTIAVGLLRISPRWLYDRVMGLMAPKPKRP